MNFADWNYYKDFNGNVMGIISPDKTQSRLLIDIEVAEWLEKGNTPLLAEA